LKLLQSLIAQPDIPLAALGMLTLAERRWLIEEVNRTDSPLPQGLCAQHPFEQQAARAPERTAVEWSSGSVTYEELNRQANRFAWRLLALGAAPDDRIGMCLDRSPEAVAAMLGIFKAGSAFLPLPADLPQERMQDMLETARPRIVIARRD